jgi:hypothetical protein
MMPPNLYSPAVPGRKDKKMIKEYKLGEWTLRLHQTSGGGVHWYLWAAGWEEPAAEGDAESPAAAIAAVRAKIVRVLEGIDTLQL